MGVNERTDISAGDISVFSVTGSVLPGEGLNEDRDAAAGEDQQAAEKLWHAAWQPMLTSRQGVEMGQSPRWACPVETTRPMAKIGATLFAPSPYSLPPGRWPLPRLAALLARHSPSTEGCSSLAPCHTRKWPIARRARVFQQPARSGQPGRRRSCSLTRNPIRRRRACTRLSGVVLLPRIRLMFHERLSGESLSLMSGRCLYRIHGSLPLHHSNLHPIYPQAIYQVRKAARVNPRRETCLPFSLPKARVRMVQFLPPR